MINLSKIPGKRLDIDRMLLNDFQFNCLKTDYIRKYMSNSQN